MPSISFMTITDYKANLQQDVGGLMFSGQLYDCGHNVDKDKLRKDYKEELKGKRIHAVLIYTEDSPKFSKAQNTLIKYKNPSVADKGQEGAFQRDHAHPQISQMWWSNHPMGDAIVVYTEPKVKVEGVPSASELKNLRKKWKDLEESYKQMLEENQRKQPVGDFEGREAYVLQCRESLKVITTPMLEAGKVLMKHDTPFIQNKVSTFVWLNCNMKWNDDWVEE